MVDKIAIELERNTPTGPELHKTLQQTKSHLTDLRGKLRGLDPGSREILRLELHESLADPPTATEFLASLDTQHERLQLALDRAAKEARALKSPRRGPKISGWQLLFEDYLAKSLTKLGIAPSKNRVGVFATVLKICVRYIETPLGKNPSRTRTPKASFRRIKKAVDRTR